MKKLVVKNLVIKKLGFKIAALCLAVSAVTFCSIVIEQDRIQKVADQLFDSIHASIARSHIDEIITNELNKRTKYGQEDLLDRLLECAINKKCFDKAEIFLSHGANPNARTKYAKRIRVNNNQTLLMYYAGHGDAEQVRFLLDHRADPMRYDDYYGIPALFYILFNRGNNNISAIVNLFAKVVPIDCPASKTFKQYHYGLEGITNKTLLYMAVHQQQMTTLKGDSRFSLIHQLLRLGASPNCIPHPGDFSPTDYAIRYIMPDKGEKHRYYGIAKLLYCYGGRPQHHRCLLTDAQREEFEKEKEVFNLFKADRSYLMQQLAQKQALHPLLTVQTIGGECEGFLQEQHQALYGEALGGMFQLVLPIAEVARIVRDYHGPCTIPDFIGEEKGATEDVVVEEEKIHDGDGDGAEDYDDGELGDDSEAGNCDGDGKNYGDDDEKADY